MNTKPYLSENLVGTWKFTSWTYQDSSGATVPYFGDDATGILQYERGGYMSVQLMRGHRQPFASEALDGSTQQEAYDAYTSYIAYYGKYREDRPGEIIHVIEGSLFPNWIGKEQLRYGEISGNTLILKTPPILVHGSAVAFRLTWEALRRTWSKSSTEKDRKIGSVF